MASAPQRTIILAILAAVVLPVVPAQAQTSIRGYTRDGMHRPMAGVEVLVQGISRSVFSNVSGYFVFDSLPAAEHRVTARLPGYAAARAVISTASNPAVEVELRLERMPQILDSVAVVATRRGLYGVVADSARRPVAGARVEVYGGGTRGVTDSSGRFAFPQIRGGDYVVVASVGTLTGRPLHVAVPNRGSVEVVLHVLPPDPTRIERPGLRWRYHDLGIRLAMTPSWKRMGSEELRRFAGRSLCDVARIRAVAGGDVATIVVNGEQVLYEWPICAFSTDEVALVEWSTCVALGSRVNLPPVVRTRGSSTRGQVRCLMVWTR